MLKVMSYDEQRDLFLISPIDSDAEFTIDAGSLASMLNLYDEPHTFIGLTFSVEVHA